MRLSGAKLQQRLTEFILKNYTRSNPRRKWLKQMLSDFWQGYHRLVISPLEAKGYNIKPDTGMEFVLTLKQGVKGMVATCLMARDSG